MPNNLSGGASEPPSLEKRLPLALGLMMLVLLVSQYLFKPPQRPKTVAPPPAQKQEVVKQQKVPAAADVPGASAAAGAGQIAASTEQITEVDTDLYHIVLTNRGGVVKSWVLKRYADAAGKPLQLVHQTAFEEQNTNVPLPFAIEIKDQRITVDPNTALYQVARAPDGMGVEYGYSDGRTVIRKSFGFSKNSYLADVHSSVVTNDTPVAHFLQWRGGFGDPKAFRAATNGRTVRYDATAGKLIEKTVKDAKDGATTDAGNYTFGGLEDNFFAAVALPASSSLEVRTYSDSLKVPGEDKPQPFVGGGLSTGAQNDFTLFVGPKDLDVLKKVNPKLTQIIDWGFFGILAKPLFLWLNWTADHWTGNYGWAIVVVTLIINVVLFPLKFSSLRSARKMQRLQPQIKAINDRYKNIKINDPKKAEQNQEVMALYKKEGVNPVGGCLPLLIQMPFLYAFYRVLSIAIELRHAPWLWVSDLSAPETIAIHILPVVLVITQFLTQRMTPSPGVDPNQQKMMLFMPLVFGYIFWFLSSGLVLYYLTSNLVGIAQQLIINRFMPAPPVEPPAKAPVKKVSRK